VYSLQFIELEQRDQRLKVVLDLDGTLVSSHNNPEDAILRDGAFDLVTQLQAHGIKIVLWTSSARARAIIEKFKLSQLLDIVIARENFRLPDPINESEKFIIPESILQKFCDFHSKYANIGKYLQFLGYPLLVEDWRHIAMAQEGGFALLYVPEFNPDYEDLNTTLPPNLEEQILAVLEKPPMQE